MFAAAPGHSFASPEIYQSALPLLVILVPILLGIILYFLKEEWVKVFKATSLVGSLFALAGVLLLLRMVISGQVRFNLIDFMQMGLFFKVDLIGWIFALIIALVWTLATVFSFAYMDYEHNLRRYYSLLTITLGATLGVVLAGDFFTLFLFFEMMTLSSFILVIHEQDSEAMKAGMLYLYLGIGGGLCLLFAVMMLFSITGSVDIAPAFNLLGGQRTIIFICFLIGFGVKAGLVPLHIWLPQAHPVAPSPASALLSGILIKSGAYGILRVSLVLFSSPDSLGSADASYIFNLGNALMWIGIITMFLGAVMAILQSNMKRILAYSSVSQIGYIVAAIGAAALMNGEGGMGFAGAVYHVINHAFFKAGLFMMVGTVFMFTRELELPRLGGMFKKMPLVGITFLIAAFGIAGIPGFNGYASKTLIHDALLVAMEHYELFSIELAEKIFVLTSALTICYFIKLFQGVFLGPVPEKLDREYRLPFSVQAVLVSFALVITGIGLFPNFVLEKIIIPAASILHYEGPVMEHLHHFHFFEWPPLEAMLIVIALALIIYIPGAWRGWFEWKPPWWLSIYAIIYKPVTEKLVAATCRMGVLVDSSVDNVYNRSGSYARKLCSYVVNIDEGIDNFYASSGKAARHLADRSTEMDSALDETYRKTGRAAQKLARQTTDMDKALNKVYDQAGQKTREEMEKMLAEKKNKEDRRERRKWSIENLSFDNLLLVLVLAVVSLIIFYFSRL
ncbi:MAG: complex I subunit 5 family protein [Bacillota bacterium]|nr:complex I subunit 5 family protein [Bacillota bacterium]